MAKSELTIQMNSKVDRAVKGIEKVSGQLETMQDKVHAAVGKFQGFAIAAGAAFAIVKAGVNTVKDLTEAYKIQEKAEAGLQAAWKATDGAVGMSIGELKKLADSYADVTTFTDDAIIQAEQMLVTTKKIGEDVMPRATMAALDLATGLGTDLTGAAEDLGKVLANPIEEIESLKEKNIFLDDATKDMIINLAEQNKLFEAQSLILDEVEASYGGVAKEVADIPTAKLDQIAKAWTDIKEDLGGALLNTVQPALDDLYESLQDIKKWADDINLKSDITRAIKDGASLQGYSNEELEWYIKELGAIRTYAEQAKVDAVNNEINARASANRWNSMDKANPIPSSMSTDTGLMSLDPSMAGGKNNQPGFGGKTLRFKQVSSNKLDDRMSAWADEAAAYNSLLWDMASATVSVNYTNETLAEAEKKRIEALVEAYTNVSEQMSLWGNATSSVLSQSFALADQLYQNDIDALQKQLEEKEALYDDFFDSVDGKYAKEQEALDRYYATGLMSAEDYLSASEDLDNEEAEAKEEAQEKMDEIQAEADKIKQKQFNAKKANDLAQAVINGAISISDIWAKHGANPVVAGILTGLSTTAIAAQIATISAQKYTPMAAGGIVESPTRALIGEAGPEAIIPLNNFNLERKGLSDASKKGITIVVNVENNYTESDLAESVYNGIERAQHAGLLPSWSFV